MIVRYNTYMPRSLVVKKSPTRRIAKTTSVRKRSTKSVKKSPASTTPKSTARPINKNDLFHLRRQPLGHLLVEQLVREGGFRGEIASDTETLRRYSTDESIFSVTPQIVLCPKTPADVERAVAVIAKEKAQFPSLSITPRAAGTGLSGGSLTDSVVMDVSRHLTHVGDVVTHRGGPATITVGPGAPWRTVEKHLKKAGLYIPSYPASKDICTIGGAIANNAAGPDSLRFGHCADWVASLDVVLHDGCTYTIRPLRYKEMRTIAKQSNALGRIVREIYQLIEDNERIIKRAQPHTSKNSAGYALWDVLDCSVADFKKGKGMFDLTRLISGSQGTLGIVTSITLKTELIAQDTALVVVPVFDLADASNVIDMALRYDPINIELFDALTFDLALKHPEFFKDRVAGADYYKVLLSMYTLYHVRYKQVTPEFTLLVTIDRRDLTPAQVANVVDALKSVSGKRARLVGRPSEQEMFWQIRRASYSLSKLEDPTKRPAAFLEDMTVPPQHLSRFFTEIKRLLKKYNVTAAVHGHGGNGHLHFYPLLDFNNKTTPALVEKMAEEFFATALKYDGSLCGEHNDGIIRTPHLSKMFSKNALGLFEATEHIFDPQDIFNPGKKVHPRFDIKETIRKTN